MSTTRLNLKASIIYTPFAVFPNEILETLASHFDITSLNRFFHADPKIRHNYELIDLLVLPDRADLHKAFIAALKVKNLTAAHFFLKHDLFNSIPPQNLKIACKHAVYYGFEALYNHPKFNKVRKEVFEFEETEDLGVLLYDAAQSGNLGLLKAIITSERFDNIDEKHTVPILTAAALQENEQLLQLLLNSSRFKNVSPKNLIIVLRQTIQKGYTKTSNVIIHSKQFDSVESLYMASRKATIKKSDLEIIKAIINSSSINLDNLGLALKYSATSGNQEIVNLIVSNPKFNKKEFLRWLRSAIDDANLNKKQEIAVQLIDHPQSKKTSPAFIQRIFHGAGVKDNENVIISLIDHLFFTKVDTQHVVYVLEKVAMSGNEKAVKALIKTPQFKDISSKQQKRIIKSSITSNHKNTTHLLLKGFYLIGHLPTKLIDFLIQKNFFS